MPERDVAATFVRWICMRAALHRGWWLATSLYLVAVADLSAFQLVFIGTAQGVTGLVFEVPAGVLADTLSRKWSLVVAHALMGTGMLVTGLVTSFPALVATQMLWGLAWTFSTGADVAWLTDELDRPDRVAGVLTAGARLEQLGAAAGMIGFGALAWASDLATAIVVAGAAMWVLGLFVAVRFGEHRFAPTRDRHWRASLGILRRGFELARRDPAIAFVFAATVLVNGAAEAYGRLFPKRLVDLGLPQVPDPIVWLSALGLVTLAVGAVALRIVEARIDGSGGVRRLYAVGCFVGAVGAFVLAIAPDDLSAMAGVVLVGGVALSVTRCVSVIWVNRRSTSEVRATVQSFLAQAEYIGEIGIGVGLGILAQATGIPFALLGSCALLAAAGALIARSRTDRAAPAGP